LTPLRGSDRRLAAAFVVLFVGVNIVAGAAPAAGTQQTVKVWFLQGEQMTTVTRPGSTAEDAIRELLRGPTAAETKQGVETYVPAGTKLRSVTVVNGLATVDLSLKLALGRDGASLLARPAATSSSTTRRRSARSRRARRTGTGRSSGSSEPASSMGSRSRRALRSSARSTRQ
jgi:Sporulation and spore germination